MKKLIMAVAMVAVALVANAKMTDADTIAATLWLEARGEGHEGIQAVASVIANRAAKSGKTMAQECLKPKQFSCWNGVKVAIPKKAKGEVWEFCKTTAKTMVNGTFKPTVKATHYYNPKLCNPKWGAKMTDVVMIGRHRFGRC